MDALKRFFTIGFADADARIAYLLAPRPSGAVDGYLASSTVVRAFDGVTRRLRDWWDASGTARAQRTFLDDWHQQPWSGRYEAIAVVLLTAVVVHIVMTVANGPRPGWFWLILPGLAAFLAVLLLAGSRTRLRQ